MKKLSALVPLVAVLIMTGCTSAPADETESKLTETSAPEPLVTGEETLEPTDAEIQEQLEELENFLENFEIVERSQTDLGLLSQTIKTTIFAIDSKGIAQIEVGLFGESIQVFDASRKVGKRALTVYDQSDPSPTVLWMSEEILGSARTFEGFYRIDMLITEIESIKNILDFDSTLPDGTTAEDYENITTANGFAFRSPGTMAVDVIVTVVDGKITKIVDIYSDGNVTSVFDYNVANYDKYFAVAF